MGYAVKSMMRMLKKRFRQEEIDLTLEQYFLLNILDHEEGLILQDLADIVDRDKSVVLRHINGLEENYFVARTADPQDRRRKLLLVTKRGINVLKRARALDEQINDEVTRNIGDEGLQKFQETLTNIYEQAIKEHLC
jgi:DNA-binding MarR family transcriptional regulator